MFDTHSLDGFDWDDGNRDKNWLKHGVSNSECEGVFFNVPLLLAGNVKHSETEQRYLALGRMNGGRLLFISFVIRMDKLRVISARDMHREERTAYAQANP